MKKTATILILLLNISLQIKAGSIDSLCKVKIDSQEFILHHVEPKETIYALSKRYNVEMWQILHANYFIKDTIISPGQVIKIPFITETRRAEVPADSLMPVYHHVEKGETLYGITRKYEKVNLDLIKIWNDLSGDTVKWGQKLIVGWKVKANGNDLEVNVDTMKVEKEREGKVDLIPVAADTITNKVDTIFINEERQRADKKFYDMYNDHAGDSIYQEMVNEGMATWLPMGGNGNRKMLYALHKSAPTGTILKVKNLMNNREIFVKVIGELPANADKYTLLTLSSFAARELGVLDPKFRVAVTYFLKNDPVKNN